MCIPPDSVIRLQIKWQALFEFFPVCLVPMVFLFAAGATVGAVLSAKSLPWTRWASQDFPWVEVRITLSISASMSSIGAGFRTK